MAALGGKTLNYSINIECGKNKVRELLSTEKFYRLPQWRSKSGKSSDGSKWCGEGVKEMEAERREGGHGYNLIERWLGSEKEESHSFQMHIRFRSDFFYVLYFMARLEGEVSRICFFLLKDARRIAG